MGNVIGWIIAIIVAIILYQRNRKKNNLKAKVEKINTLLNDYSDQVSNALNKWDQLTNFRYGYFCNHDLVQWLKSFKEVYVATNNLELHLEGISNSAIIQKFISTYKNVQTKRIEYNQAFIKREIGEYNQFFNNIEIKGLDMQQMTAIVTNEDNNLVIAGAGTGKTTTITGKVSYLIDRYKIDPKEILLISFTNKACEEMRERIKKKLNLTIDVKTFHKLGLDILAASKNEKPSVFSLGKRETDEIFQKIFQTHLKDKGYLDLVTKYFTSYLKPYKEENEFKSEGERMQFLKDQHLVGLKKIVKDGFEYRERLKSQEEVEIANFLFLHGVNYTYEEWYEFKTASRTFGQYKPDFKINGFSNQNNKGIYIEHFAIDKLGNVPRWFKADGQQSATQKYNAGIKWKRNIHKEKGTTLIETYSHERKEGNLIPNLIQKLKDNNIEITKKSPEQIWQILVENDSEDISGFIQLVQTFLSLLKSNNYHLNEIAIKATKIDRKESRLRALAFLKIFKPLYESYEKLLALRGEIDFSDMVNKATECVRKRAYLNRYKYILIDEFQDISIGRYHLIKSLLSENSNCKLFCVGDDWQSIYRFSGSDIALFTRFEEYFGITSKSYIEKTYRFDNKLIEVSSDFILKNPKQFSKGLKTDKIGKEKPFTVLHYNFNSTKIWDAVQEALEDIIKRCQGDFTKTNVLLLGRYNHDINELNKCPELFSVEYSQKNETKLVTYRSSPKLKISFLSVHAAKGREADYVILLNGNSGRYGFPSEISDDPLLNLVLTDADQFPNGEERRLFYVAITRTRNHVYIISNEDVKSKFVTELEDRDINVIVNKCPWCDVGKLILRESAYGLFFGCSNFPHYCNYTKKITGSEIFELGETERKTGKFEAAIELYKKAQISDNPPNDVHFYLGHSLYELGKFSDCIPPFEKYILTDRSGPAAYYWLGCANLELKEHSRAIEYFSQAIKNAKGNQLAYFKRGRCFLETKRFAEAKNDFSSILEVNPNDINALLLMGEAKFLLDDKYGCWQDWKKAESLGSTTVQSFFDYYDFHKEPQRANLNLQISDIYVERINAIEQAINSDMCIKFNYRKSATFNSGEKSLRTIKPEKLIEVGITNSPCVEGYCYMRKEK